MWVAFILQKPVSPVALLRVDSLRGRELCEEVLFLPLPQLSWAQVATLVKGETSSTGLSRAAKATHSASPDPFHPHPHVQWIFVSEYISLNNKTFITLSFF